MVVWLHQRSTMISLLSKQVFTLISYLLVMYSKADNISADTMVWDRPSVAGSVPSGRTAHSSAVHGKKLFVFGGMNMSGALNDLYVLNTGTWFLIKERIQIGGKVLGGRVEAIFSMAVARSRV